MEAWLRFEHFQEQHLNPWLTSWLIFCLKQEANHDKCTKHKGGGMCRGLDISSSFKNSRENPKHIGRLNVTLKLNWKVPPTDDCLADFSLGWFSACPSSKATAATSLTQMGEFRAQTWVHFWCTVKSFLSWFTGASVLMLLWFLQSQLVICLYGRDSNGVCAIFLVSSFRRNLVLAFQKKRKKRSCLGYLSAVPVYVCKSIWEVCMYMCRGQTSFLQQWMEVQSALTHRLEMTANLSGSSKAGGKMLF